MRRNVGQIQFNVLNEEAKQRICYLIFFSSDLELGKQKKEILECLSHGYNNLAFMSFRNPVKEIQTNNNLFLYKIVKMYFLPI